MKGPHDTHYASDRTPAARPEPAVNTEDTAPLSFVVVLLAFLLGFLVGLAAAQPFYWLIERIVRLFQGEA